MGINQYSEDMRNALASVGISHIDEMVRDFAIWYYNLKPDTELEDVIDKIYQLAKEYGLTDERLSEFKSAMVGVVEKHEDSIVSYNNLVINSPISTKNAFIGIAAVGVALLIGIYILK